MQTSVRVSTESRDRLAKIAQEELGGASLDEVVSVLLFEHESRIAIARLKADPEALADYQREAREWAELDIEVQD